jgi:hypothetical protein
MEPIAADVPELTGFWHAVNRQVKKQAINKVTLESWRTENGERLFLSLTILSSLSNAFS